MSVLPHLPRLPRMPLIHSFWFGIPATLVVLGLNAFMGLATRTPWGDDLALACVALFGIACIENYLACREYHCLITWPGCFLAALIMVLRVTGLVDHGFGVPRLVLAAAAIPGHTLDWRYLRWTGSTYQLA